MQTSEARRCRCNHAVPRTNTHEHHCSCTEKEKEGLETVRLGRGNGGGSRRAHVADGNCDAGRAGGPPASPLPEKKRRGKERLRRAKGGLVRPNWGEEVGGRTAFTRSAQRNRDERSEVPNKQKKNNTHKERTRHTAASFTLSTPQALAIIRQGEE